MESSQSSSADFRPLSRGEIDLVVEWAASEGWNPGYQDAEAFYLADPEAFWGMEVEGNLVGAGAIASYEGKIGFMGLFIVDPEWRGRGLGRQLWYFRRDRLLSRLEDGAPICMDGVFAMQDFYASGGFVCTHRNLRMEGEGRAFDEDPRIYPLEEVPFDVVENFDRAHFGASRTEFLRHWIQPEGGASFAFIDDVHLAGMAVVRPCRVGFKIGPLFATSTSAAESLFCQCSNFAQGHPVYLDTPENNPDALELARSYEMREAFGCARMVLGAPPDLPWDSIYGVTTFEMG